MANSPRSEPRPLLSDDDPCRRGVPLSAPAAPAARAIATRRRGMTLASTSALLFAGMLLAQAAPSCTPTSLLDPAGDDSLSTTDENPYGAAGGPAYFTADAAASEDGQAGRTLTSTELQQLLANSDSHTINVIMLNPADSAGPTGPAGPAGPPGPNAALIGEVRMWVGAPDRVPPGWRVCDGSLLPRAEHAALFELIGTRYGGGDGVSTFALPNFRNRSPMGSIGVNSAGELVTDVEGMQLAAGGEATHQLKLSELPAHDHELLHAHDIPAVMSGTIGNTHVQLAGAAGPTTTISSLGADVSRTTYAGSGAPHNTVHPYFAVLYIIHVGIPPSPAP